MDIDLALYDLSERQHGLAARDQARELGMTRHAWHHRVGTGEWILLTERVARRAGAPVTPEQQALAAVLDVGPPTFVSHESAAALWRVPGFRVKPVQVMSLRTRTNSSGLASLHRPRHLPDPFAARLDGIPVVRPSLMILQLAPLVHPERLGRIFDGLWSRRLLSAPSVRRELEGVLGRGRPGSAAVRELLDKRPPGYVPPSSNLEARFAQIIRDYDLPRMRRQVDVGDDERWCGRVDFKAEELPLVVEVQSDMFHKALTSVEDDEARKARLEAAGFAVEEVEEFDIWYRPAVVAEQVRKARRDLRRRLAA
jgi:very-short-patch-repair endonuclease